MNCKFTNVLVFAAGAAIGSAVTWKVLKTKYEQIVQDEIESVKRVFCNRQTDFQDQADEYTEVDTENEYDDNTRQINWDELEDLDEDNTYDPDDEDLVEYDRLTEKYKAEKGGAQNMAKEPYVISPYDFDEIDEYDSIELTYYADGILEDEDHEIVTDVDELIGTGSLNTFGEYEDDAVFVRNERLRADFQILKDYRTYAEARGINPARVDK